MHTSDHQFLATLIYRPATIARVMKTNTVAVLADRTKVWPDFVAPDDQQIDRVNISSATSTGILLKVHDPSRVTVQAAAGSDGQLLEEISSAAAAIAAINASAYRMNQSKGLPLGLVIADGQVLSKGQEPRYSVIGLNQSHQLLLGIYFDTELEQLKLRDAVEYGPFLVINGQRAAISGNGGGLAPRTAIGQTREGTILLLVMDGRQLETFGATMQDMQKILLEHGAVNAACLDGGASVSMTWNGSIINSVNGKEENRRLPNAFIVK